MSDLLRRNPAPFGNGACLRDLLTVGARAARPNQGIHGHVCSPRLIYICNQVINADFESYRVEDVDVGVHYITTSP